MATIYQTTLKSSAEHALALLNGIKDGEEDYKTLRKSYDSALDNRKQLFGEALFLDLRSITEMMSGESDLSEHEIFELERSVEMINLATFAFHVFYTTEIQTCVCAFFRIFKPLIDVYSSIEIDMYKILKMALFRQRFNASDNIAGDIADIIDRTFPAEDSTFFHMYYLPDEYTRNDHTIKWLMDLREKVLRMLPVENLDPEEFADEEEIRDILKQFLEHRYFWYENEGCNPDQNQQELDEISNNSSYETCHSDEDQSIQQLTITSMKYEHESSRKQTESSFYSERLQISDEQQVDSDIDDEPPQKRSRTSPPSVWSQIADEDENTEHDEGSPHLYQLQTSEEDDQPRHRSLFSPDPNAYILSPVEAGFGEDIACFVSDDEADELAEDSSVSNASPSPNIRYLSYEICQGTQTSPSLLHALLPASVRSRRILPTIGHQTTGTTSQETTTQHAQEATTHGTSSNSVPVSQNTQATLNDTYPIQSSVRSNNTSAPVREPVVAESSRSEACQTPIDDNLVDIPDDMFINAGKRLQKIPQVRKTSVYWTDEEEKALEEGVRKYGRQWSRILKEYPPLRSRNAQSLKDKAVNVYKKRKRLNQDLGGFRCMDKPTT